MFQNFNSRDFWDATNIEYEKKGVLICLSRYYEDDCRIYISPLLELHLSCVASIELSQIGSKSFSHGINY